MVLAGRMRTIPLGESYPVPRERPNFHAIGCNDVSWRTVVNGFVFCFSGSKIFSKKTEREVLAKGQDFPGSVFGSVVEHDGGVAAGFCGGCYGPQGLYGG